MCYSYRNLTSYKNPSSAPLRFMGRVDWHIQGQFVLLCNFFCGGGEETINLLHREMALRGKLGKEMFSQAAVVKHTVVPELWRLRCEGGGLRPA